MHRSTRACLVPILFAASMLTAVTASSAQTQPCAVTVKKSGYQFHALGAKSMDCTEANALLERALNISYPQRVPGYKCTQRPGPTGGLLICDATEGSSKQITASWSMPSQRR